MQLNPHFTPNSFKNSKKFASLYSNAQFQPSFSHNRTFMRNLLLLSLVLTALVVPVYGQQDPQYTMYMFNRLAVNPATAGALEATNVTLLARAQWVGIEGAPKTSTLTGSAYLRKISSGLGVAVIADGLGPLRTMGLGVDYAFHIKTGTNSRLNIGVHGGFYQKGLYVPKGDWKYNKDNGDDPIVNISTGKSFVPDLGAGLYYHVNRKGLTTKAQPQDAFYIGASVSHILEPSLEGLFEDQGQGIGVNSKVWRGMNATAGVTIPVSKNIFIQPSFFFRTNLNTMQNDLSVNLFVSPMVFGLNYRGMFAKNNESVGGTVGFNANTNLFIGYAYDFNFSAFSGYTSGSHELILSYTFPNSTLRPPPINNTEGQSAF